MHEELVRMSDEKRIRSLENIRVTYPRQKKVIDEIQRCREKSKYTREPQCMLIYGNPGVGKSTIKEIYLSRENVTGIKNENNPVLVMNSPILATIKSMLSSMLNTLGDPASEKGTVQTMSNRLKKMMEKKGIELVIIDEFQRLIDCNSRRILKDVAETITLIMEETKIPFVFIGLPLAQQVFKSEEYLARRCMKQESFEAFNWNSEFLTFLKIVDKNLPLYNRSNLTDEDRAFKIHTATNGVAHYVMTLIKESAEMAIKNKCETITDHLLAAAYRENLRSIIQKKNPFGPDNDGWEPDKTKENLKEKKSSLREVLKT